MFLMLNQEETVAETHRYGQQRHGYKEQGGVTQKKRIWFLRLFRLFCFHCRHREKKPGPDGQHREQEPQCIVGRTAEDPDQSVRQEQEKMGAGQEGPDAETLPA